MNGHLHTLPFLNQEGCTETNSCFKSRNVAMSDGVKESETLFRARRLAGGRVWRWRCGKGWVVEL